MYLYFLLNEIKPFGEALHLKHLCVQVYEFIQEPEQPKLQEDKSAASNSISRHSKATTAYTIAPSG